MILSCLSCSTCSESLRSIMYERQRLLMGFSRTFGIGSLLMQNLSLTNRPLTIEIAGFNLNVHPFNVTLELIQQAFVQCFCCCDCCHVIHVCPDWTKTQSVSQMLPTDQPSRCLNNKLHCHAECLGRDGAAHHHAILWLLQDSSTVLCCDTELEVLEEGFDVDV